MRARLAVLFILGCLGAAVTPAQTAQQAAPAVQQADFSSVYCSGFVSDQKVPDEIRLISGEQSNSKLIFSRGDYVYINRGQDKGVRVGDRFTVVRPVKDPTDVPWFKWQDKLMRAMGTAYQDTGQVRVVNVQPKVSIAQIIFSCEYMQRGDVVEPYQDRPAPSYKDPAAFDHFAPVSGKPVAMVVSGTDFALVYGKNHAMYVNLGSNQGVKVGDYLRIFRYQGSMAETVPIEPGFQYTMFGFGSTPERYQWNDLPREILGEGMVISVSRNSSTVVLTYSSTSVYAGDYVEIE
jgi:Flagellar assembly protein T, C-terminal domain